MKPYVGEHPETALGINLYAHPSVYAMDMVLTN